MITIFSTLKPGYGYRQQNAVESWVLLPRSHVLLIGKEALLAAIGRDDVAVTVGVRRNGAGVPQVDSLFETAQEWSSDDLFLYVNADIILWDDIIVALEDCAKRFPVFLMVGQRTNINVPGPVTDYDNLRNHIPRGELLPPCGCDYFGFTRGLWEEIPPYAVGRTAFDNWLVNAAIKAGKPVIDVTERVGVVHQDHPCSCSPVDAQSNHDIVPGIGYLGWVTDSTYVY